MGSVPALHVFVVVWGFLEILLFAGELKINLSYQAGLQGAGYIRELLSM